MIPEKVGFFDPDKHKITEVMKDFSQSFGLITLRKDAVRWTQSMDLLKGEPGELYILDEKFGKMKEAYRRVTQTRHMRCGVDDPKHTLFSNFVFVFIIHRSIPDWSYHKQLFPNDR